MHGNGYTRISMGKPVMAPVLVPVLHKSTPACVAEPFLHNGELYRLTCMSFGTPHGVVFVDAVDKVDVEALGLALGTHPRFPEGASIVFAQMLDRKRVKARLWQRGVGEFPFTLEAASAAATVAIMLQKTDNYHADVTMGTQEFQIDWEIGDGSVYLMAPSGLLVAAAG